MVNKDVYISFNYEHVGQNVVHASLLRCLVLWWTDGGRNDDVGGRPMMDGDDAVLPGGANNRPCKPCSSLLHVLRWSIFRGAAAATQSAGNACPRRYAAAGRWMSVRLSKAHRDSYLSLSLFLFLSLSLSLSLSVSPLKLLYLSSAPSHPDSVTLWVTALIPKVWRTLWRVGVHVWTGNSAMRCGQQIGNV